MAFPVSPSDGQSAVVNNVLYTYNSSKNTWTRVPGNTILGGAPYGYANVIFDNANSAYSKANSAGLYANGSFEQANAAFAYANTLAGGAAAQFAFTQANAAYTQANTATTNAATSDSKAVSAGSYANSAFLVANSASTAATTADGKAVTAGSYANSAYTQANTATTNALAASTYANSAYVQANTATTDAAAADSKALSAGSYANSAYGQANSATTAAATADSKAVSAGSYANSAYTQANTGVTNASAASSYANSAFIKANTAATDSLSAGSYANSAFTKANNALANTTGTFAGDLSLTGKLIAMTVGGDEGGEILLGKPTTNTTLSGTGVTIDVYQNKLRIFEQGGAARGAYIDLTAASAGVGSDLLIGGSGGATDTTARTSAEAAFSAANSAGSYANGAFVQANSAYSSANAISLRTDGAFIQANAAFIAANIGKTFVQSGGTITGSVTISQDLNVSGNIIIGGNTTSISSNNLTLNDSLLYLANGNSGNTVDIGLVGQFLQGRYQHTGVVRDHLDGRWKFFSNVVAEPSTTVDFANAQYDIIKSGGLETVGSINIGTVAFVGSNTGSALGGATNPIIGSLGSSTGYIQTYIYNTANGTSSSADLVAYPNNGTDSAGWIDMGITSNNFTDATFNVTGRNEGYVFMSAPNGVGTSGNLIFATDSTGVHNAVEIYTGGFAQGKTNPALLINNTKIKTTKPIAFVDNTLQNTAAAPYAYTNASFTTANTALDASSSAGTYANGAFIQANTGVTNAATADSKAVTAGSYANSAYTQANTATNNAAGASLYANGAFIQANSAVTNALAASTYANAAFIQANTGVTNAATADSKAVSAGSYANSAYTQANTATTNAATADAKAVSAGSYANSAFLVANTASSTAISGATYANGAFIQANNATNNAAGASQYANSAFNYANSAYVQANTATTNAATADSKADSAGTYANGAFIQANTAISNAAGASLYANAAFLAANNAGSSAAVVAAFLQANAAFIQANAAYAQANTGGGGGGTTDTYARDTANAAYIHANAAYAQANTGGGGGAGATNLNLVADTFTGDGSTVSFTLSQVPTNINYLFVNVDGISQLSSSYSLSGATLSFSEAPVSGAIIDVKSFKNGTGIYTTRSTVGNGSEVNYTVTNGVDANNVIVTENGVVQTPIADYTVSGAVLTFNTAPATGVKVQIRELGVAVVQDTYGRENSNAAFAKANTGTTLGKSIAMTIVFGG